MKTDNELIAEFMGAKVHLKWGEYVDTTYFAPQRGNSSPFGPDEATKERIRLAEAKNLWEPKYDTSWDWLMPVVEKITTMEDTFDKFVEENEGEGMLNQLTIFATHEDVYKAVVEFIKWYNQQKP